jgi:hypothetical protein
MSHNRRPQLGSREDWIDFAAYLIVLTCLLIATVVVDGMAP